MRLSTSRALALSVLLLTACPIEPVSFDAGTPDSGLDEACLQQPMGDSGVLITECNPADGTRCDISRMQACSWNVLTDEGECTCSSQRQALGESCNLGRQDCEPGTSCLFFADATQPTCQSVCSLSDGQGCEALQALSPEQAFACVPVRRGSPVEPTTAFGVCYEVGRACDPLADTCPAADKCSFLGSVTACAPAGTRARGETCSNEACERGSLCVALQSMAGEMIPATCYEPCSINAPACSAGSCANIGLSFGICFEP